MRVHALLPAETDVAGSPGRPNCNLPDARFPPGAWHRMAELVGICQCLSDPSLRGGNDMIGGAESPMESAASALMLVRSLSCYMSVPPEAVTTLTEICEDDPADMLRNRDANLHWRAIRETEAFMDAVSGSASGQNVRRPGRGKDAVPIPA